MNSISDYMTEAFDADNEFALLGDDLTEEEVEDSYIEDPEDHEAEEAEAEVEKASTANEVVSSAAEKVEEVANDVEESLEHGGLTAREAYHVNKRLEAAQALTGLPTGEFSQEAFEEEGGRLAQTEYMLEDIKENLGKMWKAIKDFLARMWQNAKNFFNLTRQRAKRLQGAAKKIGVAAGKASGSKKSDNISVGAGLAKYLHTNDKNFNVKDYIRSVKDMIDETGIEAYEISAKNAREAVGKILSNDKKEQKELDAYLKDKASVVGKTFEKKTVKKLTGGDKDVFIGRGPTKPGGVCIEYRIEGGKNPKIKLVKAEDAPTFDGKVDVKALNKAEIASLAGQVAALGSRSAKFAEKIGGLEKEISALLKEGDKAAKTADEDSQKAARLAMMTIRQWTAHLAPTGIAELKHNLTVGNAALSFAKMNLKNLGAEASTGDDEGGKKDDDAA